LVPPFVWGGIQKIRMGVIDKHIKSAWLFGLEIYKEDFTKTFIIYGRRQINIKLRVKKEGDIIGGHKLDSLFPPFILQMYFLWIIFKKLIKISG